MADEAKKGKITSMKDAFGLVKASSFFKIYFGKDASKVQFYHKKNGYDSNGKEQAFTAEETGEIKTGLKELAKDINEFTETL